jgi:hypothetical protein
MSVRVDVGEAVLPAEVRTRGGRTQYLVQIEPGYRLSHRCTDILSVSTSNPPSQFMSLTFDCYRTRLSAIPGAVHHGRGGACAPILSLALDPHHL